MILEKPSNFANSELWFIAPKVLQRSIKITPVQSLCILGILVLPKTAKKSWKFWCHKNVDLFVEDPIKKLFPYLHLLKTGDTSANFNSSGDTPFSRHSFKRAVKIFKSKYNIS